MGVKVFASWSKRTSLRVARALKIFVEEAFVDVRVFVSDQDVDAGDRWQQVLGDWLEQCAFGIVCLTPDNQGSNWMMFEAGALAKTLDSARVIPMLVGLEPRHVSGPLAQFQMVEANKQGALELLKAVNLVRDDPVSDKHLGRVFARSWPDLEREIEAASVVEAGEAPVSRTSEEVLGDVLEASRTILREVRGLAAEGPDVDSASRSKRSPAGQALMQAVFFTKDAQIAEQLLEASRVGIHGWDLVSAASKHFNLDPSSYGVAWVLMRRPSGRSVLLEELYVPESVQYLDVLRYSTNQASVGARPSGSEAPRVAPGQSASATAGSEPKAPSGKGRTGGEATAIAVYSPEHVAHMRALGLHSEAPTTDGSKPATGGDAAGRALEERPATSSRTVRQAKGSVKWWDKTKRYGFVTRDDGTDCFVHHTSLAGVSSLTQGQRVSFSPTNGPKGPIANDVSPLMNSD